MEIEHYMIKFCLLSEGIPGSDMYLMGLYGEMWDILPCHSEQR